jgi:hypothetical protein
MTAGPGRLAPGDRPAEASGSRWVVVGRGLGFAWKYEMRLWGSLLRWVARRPPAVEAGATTFPYAGAVAPLFSVFIGLSALEIPILHLILPWQTARIISWIVGGYGLFWMIGLLATLRVYPHVVGPAGLRIRNGTTLDVVLPWDAIGEIRLRRRSMPPGGSIQIDEERDARILSIGVGSQTSVDVLLSRPMTVAVAKTRGAPVTQIRFHADDPDAVVAAARDRSALPDQP